MMSEQPARDKLKLQIPEASNRLRWLILLCGLLIFIWLGIEGNALAPVLLLSLITSCLATIGWLLHRLGGQSVRYLAALGLMALSGATIGAGTGVTSAFLMFFKNARHSHVFPDFPVGMILAMLARAPVWAVAGALIGISVGLVWLAVR